MSDSGFKILAQRKALNIHDKMASLELRNELTFQVQKHV